MTMTMPSSLSSSLSRKEPWRRRRRLGRVAAAAVAAAAATSATMTMTTAKTTAATAILALLLLLAPSSSSTTTNCTTFCHAAAAATAEVSRGKSRDVLRQHHIRPAQRKVPYTMVTSMGDRRRALESSSSSSSSSSSQQSAARNEALLAMARAERVAEEKFHSLDSSLPSSEAHNSHNAAVYYWHHLLVDASLQSADDVFRELQQQPQQNGGTQIKMTATSTTTTTSSRSVRGNHNDHTRRRASAAVAQSRTTVVDEPNLQHLQQKQQRMSSLLLPRFLQSLLFASKTAAENNDNEVSDNVFFVNSVVDSASQSAATTVAGAAAAASAADLVSSTTPGFITTNTTTELDDNSNSNSAAAPAPPQHTTNVNTTTTTSTTIPDSLLDFNVSTQTEYNVTDAVANVPSNNNSGNSSNIDHDEMMNSGGQGNSSSSSTSSKNDTSTVVYTKSEAQTTISSSAGSSDHYDGGQFLDGENDTDPRLGFQPIRIRAILSDIDGGGGYLDNTIYTNEHGEAMLSQQEVLLQQIIGPALLSWSAALRVNPVAGNLTVDAHQLLDGISCGPGVHSGLPSAPVPVSHLTTGVADTDLLLYIHLGFVMNDAAQPDNGNSNTATNATNSPNNGTSTDSNNVISDNNNINNNTSSNNYNWRIRSNNTKTSEQSTLNRNDNNNSINGEPDSASNNDNNKTQLLRTSNTNNSSNNNNSGASTNRANNNTENHGNKTSASWLTPSNNSGYVNNNNNTGNNGSGDHDNNNTTTNTSSSWLSPPPPPLSPRHVCAGDYLAASSVCSTDQLDRPTAAILHICIGADFFEPQNLHVNILTVMHELGHALGFNAISMAYFRRPDGTPITPRNATGAIPETLVECTGPTFAHQQQQLQQQGVLATNPSSTNFSSGNISNAGSTGDVNLTQQRDGQQEQPPPQPFAPTGLTGMLPLPSSEILQFRTVRGGVRVAEVVTPSVQQVVRNHFDCQELPGAELESGEFLPLSTSPDEVSCLGDHWERRLFKSDLMNPVVDALEFNPRFSTVTLAYFADSGWYQVDLSRASLAPSWGRGSGCAFVEETCIGQDGQVPQRLDSLFCNNAPRGVSQPGFATDIDGCTPDLLRKAACSMGQYEGELPAQYQYFNGTYGSNIGGSDPFMDYCPVYMGFSNGLCSDSQNEALIKVTSMERVGSRNSRCLAGRVAKKTSSSSSSSWTTPVITKTAVCLRIACVVEDRSLRVQVDGSWHTCTREGQEIKSGTTGDIAVCPDPIRVCPTFYCPRDCLGTNHVCDYTLGSCVCSGSDCEEEVDEKEGPSNSTPPTRVAFYSPPESTAESSQPEKDSPLGDIYFPTERSLRESDEDKDRIQWELSLGFCLLAALVALITVHHRRRKRRLSLTLAQVENDDDDLDRNIATPTEASISATTANKHKMIATVVVDLRMNDPRLPHYRDVLIQRGSETDASMTETEGSSNGGSATVAATPTPSPPPTTEVNLTSTIMFDDPATRMPRFFQPNIRRRRFFSNLRHRPGT